MFPCLGASGKLDIFLQHLFWCTRSPLLFTWSCNWRQYAYYLIFIEFTSKFAGKVYPYTRIKQRKYRKSPEGLTKSVRSSGLFFLPGKCIQKGYTKQQKKSRKDVSIWQTQNRRTVRNTHADRRSESELIHYLESKPKKWIKSDSLPKLAQTSPMRGGCSISHTDAMNSTSPPLGAFVGLWDGVSRTT